MKLLQEHLQLLSVFWTKAKTNPCESGSSLNAGDTESCFAIHLHSGFFSRLCLPEATIGSINKYFSWIRIPNSTFFMYHLLVLLHEEHPRTNPFTIVPRCIMSTAIFATFSVGVQLSTRRFFLIYDHLNVLFICCLGELSLLSMQRHLFPFVQFVSVCLMTDI